jgi:DNA polymerase III subunit epsilon
MSLINQQVILLDCQTTGTSSLRDRLLEIGWSCTQASAPYPPEVHSALISQPEPPPRKAQEITGITEEVLASAESAAVAWERFHLSTHACENAMGIAHYAQFERPFLQRFYEEYGSIKVVPFPILCTYKIAQRLFPEAPSRNIRGLAGYLGCEIPQLRRAADHVLATALIWRRIAAELDSVGIKDLSALEAWLKEKSPPRKTATEFRVDRFKRLQLPKGPGIYRMLSKTGEVLYVGKASSLKSRVNSYFRGGCAGDARKLEMLARVYDIEVQECGSPLEAALLENEEIKKHLPHYNRALRPSARGFAFFSRDFSQASAVQDADHPLGPFKENGTLYQIFDFVRGLESGTLVAVFFDLVTEQGLKDGFALFCAEEGFIQGQIPSVRELLAWGMKQVRRFATLEGIEVALEEAEEESPEIDEEEEAEEIEIPEPVQVAASFRKMLVRAAEEVLRAKKLGRLLNASVSWEIGEGEWRKLRVRNGRIELGEEERPSPPAFPWAGLRMEEYDRMSVLLSELNRFPHRIE